MHLAIQRRLVDHLRHESYTPAGVEVLARDLGIDDADELGRVIEALSGDGVVEVTPGGNVALRSYASSDGMVEGRLRRNAKGFGFLQTDVPYREGDLFIPPGEMMDAQTGDTVRVQVVRERGRGRAGRGGGTAGARFVGRVVEVLERKRTSFTGRIERRDSLWIVHPDSRDMPGPVMVRDAESKSVHPGDKVVFEMVEFPEGDMLGQGVVTRVLGEAGEPDVETQAVIATYSLPDLEFPPACVDQAREATREFENQIERFLSEGPGALPGREDWTDRFICTIDPPDAKDYDDAISIRGLKGGGWELGVHIADVSHFVEPGTALDTEARRRGNSVYLPRLVIPMLPEILSNGICSLQEGVPRFCKSAIIRYDRNGKVTARGVASTVIRSRKRMTYLEAQALIDGDVEEARRQARTEANFTPELLSAVKQMNALAKVIERRRHGEGMITLELPDVELVFGEDGRVVDARPEDDAYTHRIIEMFMVEANEVLGNLFERLGVPLLRRIHPEPTPGDIDQMRQAAKVAGHVIPKNPTREELQGLLDATRGTPAARAVHLAVLRTLTKAEYSPALIGHFALASAAYAHFTSPIRRYPDLTVHRALAEYLARTGNGSAPPRDEPAQKALGRDLRENLPDTHDLVQAGRHCTNTEQNAEDAERELRKYLVLQLLETKVGQTYRGVVTGVNPRGVFVQLDQFLVDGFIVKQELPGDTTRSDQRPFWKIDPKTGALVDQHSGRSFNFGDLVTVVIAGVDLARRQLDLAIADPDSRAAGKARKPAAPLGGGGLGGAGGAGFGDLKRMTGSKRRSRKSKARDRGKADHRRGRKGR